MNELTGMQRKIYVYLKDYVEEHNYPPSVRDICNEVGLTSTSTVHGHLTRLENKGFIRRGSGKSRAIEIDDADRQARNRSLTVPLLGTVTAGMPIFADENIHEYLPMPKYIVADEDSFALKVRGESMIEVGINDGDFIVIKRQNYAFDGDIVVALIGDDEATVKTFYLEGKNVRLQPENETMDPLIYPAEEVQILGKVTALFRRIR
ncbi:MAG: transcriptional repressor LexA [Clostridia bacterium]|nr:transcriptional repressor LexA [Clostridia bacterium]